MGMDTHWGQETLSNFCLLSETGPLKGKAPPPPPPPPPASPVDKSQTKLLEDQSYVKDGQLVWAQLFKPNDVVSLCIVKTLIIKYGINANIFADKMLVAFASTHILKATHNFQQKCLWIRYCTYYNS